jgi:predicted component of type VI protein secretion system
MKIVTNKQSNAIGITFLGVVALFGTISIWRWKIAPYINRKRAKEAEEWANYVFEQELKEKEEKEQNKFY